MRKAIAIVQFKIHFDGVTAAAEPVLVDLCRSTQATAGRSTAVTPRRKHGPSAATVLGRPQEIDGDAICLRLTAAANCRTFLELEEEYAWR